MSTGETSTEQTVTERDDWWAWGLASRALDNPGQHTYSATYRPAGGSPFLAHPMEPQAGSSAGTAPDPNPDIQVVEARRGLFGRRRKRR